MKQPRKLKVHGTTTPYSPIKLVWGQIKSSNPTFILRVTSHTTLRARDHYASTTLIGREGATGPSSLHTMLEGPMEYVNARWM